VARRAQRCEQLRTFCHKAFGDTPGCGAATSNHLENGVDSIKDHDRTPKRGFADLSGRGMADSQIVREFGDSRLYGKLRAFR